MCLSSHDNRKKIGTSNELAAKAMPGSKSVYALITNHKSSDVAINQDENI